MTWGASGRRHTPSERSCLPSNRQMCVLISARRVRRQTFMNYYASSSKPRPCPTPYPSPVLAKFRRGPHGRPAMLSHQEGCPRRLRCVSHLAMREQNRSVLTAAPLEVSRAQYKPQSSFLAIRNYGNVMWWGDGSREPHRERGDNIFPRCALIRGMHETSHADWLDARVTWQLKSLSLSGSLGGRYGQSKGAISLFKKEKKIDSF